VLVNGQVRPRLTAAPGERERWRIINACPSRYLRLQLEDQQVQLLSRDLGRLPVPGEITEVLLAPGNRVELLLETTEGSSALVAAPVNRGGMEGMMGGGMMDGNGPGNQDGIEILTLDVAGHPAQMAKPVPAGPALRGLRGETIAARHTLAFAMGMGGGGTMMGGTGNAADTMMAFTINGREFDAERTDTPVAARTVEEWTLTNSSPMDHPVHLHVWPMRIIHDGDGDVPEPRW
jgi:FtsP/CotA-like multicopper oxidase with cupredoxin domain